MKKLIVSTNNNHKSIKHNVLFRLPGRSTVRFILFAIFASDVTLSPASNRSLPDGFKFIITKPQE